MRTRLCPTRAPGAGGRRASPARSLAAAAVLALWAGPAAWADDGALVLAAPTRSAEEASPRRLFNAALRAEEKGDLLAATQLLLAARLAPRRALADTLYARGAGLRLVRLLAPRDDDAALAAALLVDDGGVSSDLAPLIRALMRRLDDGREAPVKVWSGVLTQLRYEARLDRVYAELELDGGARHLFEADGPIGPFSAGHRVTVMVHESRSVRGASRIALVAMKSARLDGWQLLRVRRLPGRGVDPELGALPPRGG
jgi:hypothetical protein